MKTIAFHSNTLNKRGTTTAIIDYANYNELILGNKSIILYPKTFDDPSLTQEDLTQPDVVDVLSGRFEVIGYDSFDEMDQICLDKNIDFTYFIKYGIKDKWLTKTSKNLVHAVFQVNDPHGDKYAYVSKWLSDTCSGGQIGYVPHIVSLPPPDPNFNFRKELGIPDDKIVVGRYGGYNDFNLPFVQKAILELVEEDPSFVFVFINTKPFHNDIANYPDNLIFLEPIFSPYTKSNFIAGCDAMIHGRERGESFGLSISEFLFHNKPVFSWEGGVDLNHVSMLKQTGNLYNINNVKDHLKKLKSPEVYQYNYKGIVEQFSPENVMKQFDKVFLQ